MSLPVTVPFTFGNATTTQSLSSLDTNFTTITNSVNGLTNGASQINVASISATGTANSTTFLRGDGVWGTPSGGGGSGTVTSINVNGGSTGLTTSGGPVTTSGNITIAGTLIAANGGTGLTSVGTSGNVLTSNGTAWLSSAGAYPLTSGNAQNLTSGTAIGYTSIPSWVKRITVSISNLTSAATQTSVNIIQLGTGATPTYTNTGYLGSGGLFVATTSNSIAFTTGFAISATNAATFIKSGIATLTLVDAATNTWAFAWVGSMSSGVTANLVGGGYIALASALTAVQLTTVNSTDTFATGKINILYE